MNYLHPQLFFPISLFFFRSVLLFVARGFWSRFSWRKSDAKFRREVVLSSSPLCTNISLTLSFFPSLVPSLSSSVFVYVGHYKQGTL